MNSFYGGKEGRTYHIVQRYDCINLETIDSSKYIAYDDEDIPEVILIGMKITNEGNYYIACSTFSSSSNFSLILSNLYQLTGMVNCFSNGGAYVGANYGEYVIIDTVFTSGKSNLLNGLLYRRGFDYNEPLEGRPERSQYDSDEAFQAAWMNYVSHPGAGAVYVGQINGPIGKTPLITILNWDTYLSHSTVAGAYGAASTAVVSSPGAIFDGTSGATYNDNVKAAYLNAVDTNGDIIGGLITFDIPYPVLDVLMTSASTNPYALPSVVENSASTGHNFYHKWDFTIPTGKHGQDISNFEIVKGSLITPTSEEINADYDYLVYTLTDYNQQEPSSTAYLGRWPWNVVKQVSTSTFNPDNGRTVVSSTGEVQIGNLLDFSPSNTTYPKKFFSCILSGTLSSTSSLPSTYLLGQIWAASTESTEAVWRCVEINTPPVNTLQLSLTAEDDRILEGSFNNLDYLTTDLNGKVYGKFTSSSDQKYLTTINSVRAMKNEGDKLLVLYADQSVTPSNATVAMDWFDPSSSITYQNLIWHDLGTFPAQYHVYGNVTYDWIASATAGLSGSCAGWVVTAIDGDNETHIYAYDYTGGTYDISVPGATVLNTHWYPIMNIPQQYLNTIIVSDTTPSTLTDGGYWFKIVGGHHDSSS